MIPEELASQPWILYVIGAIFVLKFGSEAFPKILGPVSQAIHDHGAKRRVAAQERENREIAALREELHGVQESNNRLQSTLDEIRRHQVRHEHALMLHDAWDRAVMADPSYASRHARPPLYPISDQLG